MNATEHVNIKPVNAARNQYLAGQNARLNAELRAMAERIRRATPTAQAGGVYAKSAA